MRITTF